MFDVLIVDPDEKQFEATSLGLLYTAVSRATTLGDADGLNSAIYFQGTAMKESRIRNLNCKQGTTDEFKLSTHRRCWVNYLQSQARRSRPMFQHLMERQQLLCEWTKHAKIPLTTLLDRIDHYQLRTHKQH